MKKILTLLFLLSCCSFAFADSSSSILHPAALSNYTDLSLNYLGQIFGTVGTVLAGGQSQMMGKLFYTLNNGILLISVVVIVYSVLMSSVRLASEGVSIAQGKSTLKSLFKLALGIAIIIPSPATGYSVIQTIVMKVVIEGVGLADSIWDSGLNYLNDGGVVWAKPAGGNSQTNYVTTNNIKSIYGDSSPAFASQIFADEVCMYGSRDPLSVAQPDNSGNPVAATAPNRPNFNVYADDTTHTFNFPGLNDGATSGSACGSVSWNVKNACSTDSNCSVARTAMSSMVTGLLPLAKKYYCSQNPGSNTCRDVNSTLPKDAYPIMLNSMLNYYSAIQVYAAINGKTADKNKTTFIADAEAEGWLNAGRYFWDVMRFSANSSAALDLSTYVSTVSSPTWPTPMPTNLNKIVKGASLAIAGYALTGTGVSTGFQKYINDIYGSMHAAGVSGGDHSSHLIIGGAAAGVIGPTYIAPGVGMALTAAASGLDVIGNMFKHVGDHPNPLGFLYSLGQACLKLTIAIWVIGGVGITVGILAAGFCQASNPFAPAQAAMAQWMSPMISMICTMLWAAGFFLSYYVPLYPYMIFLFASVGWFISVIEAMVAAPLVALGITHPENHDILGKGEQAVMLLLGVFIQPSLLVIGLIAGIIFCYVSFQLLIYSFSGFMMDIMGSSPRLGHTSNILAAATGSHMWDGSILLSQPLLLIVFCTLTYTLLTQSFSLVFILRDNVMRWIGAPGSGLPSPEQLVGDTKGAISGMGKATGDASSQISTSGAASASSGYVKGLKEGIKEDGGGGGDVDVGG